MHAHACKFSQDKDAEKDLQTAFAASRREGESERDAVDHGSNDWPDEAPFDGEYADLGQCLALEKELPEACRFQ